EASSERRLHGRRRRWRWVPVTLALWMSAYFVVVAPRLRQVGWIGAVPNAALIWWVGAYEPPEQYRNGTMSPPSGAAKELARRCAASDLWGWQSKLMVRQLRLVRWRSRWPRGEPWQISVDQPSWLMMFAR